MDTGRCWMEEHKPNGQREVRIRVARILGFMTAEDFGALCRFFVTRFFFNFLYRRIEIDFQSRDCWKWYFIVQSRCGWFGCPRFNSKRHFSWWNIKTFSMECNWTIETRFYRKKHWNCLKWIWNSIINRFMNWWLSKLWKKWKKETLLELGMKMRYSDDLQHFWTTSYFCASVIFVFCHHVIRITNASTMFRIIANCQYFPPPFILPTYLSAFREARANRWVFPSICIWSIYGSFDVTQSKLQTDKVSYAPIPKILLHGYCDSLLFLNRHLVELLFLFSWKKLF